MGASVIPFIVFTVLWGGVGAVLPIFVPKGPNRGIIQVILMITGVSCWLFWLCCYVAQMNPLIGPKLEQNIVLIMAKQWKYALPSSA
ncbi:V-type proton ATPase subunit e 2-like [Diabrotica virgifera virgifera]|uniref:V-type proton ATPase subunit n=1 Tax=Diabrotica virgifera virgifera TaxID=50390 RepID=A0A6P7FX97_DIAVI|nr:V-type proton ATPase subunit e 2-like [Diabrotica virgifera virgifera]